MADTTTGGWPIVLGVSRQAQIRRFFLLYREEHPHLEARGTASALARGRSGVGLLVSTSRNEPPVLKQLKNTHQNRKLFWIAFWSSTHMWKKILGSRFQWKIVMASARDHALARKSLTRLAFSRGYNRHLGLDCA